MKLKEDLVKRLREGEVTVEYDGESLDKLREVLGSVNTMGMFEYYSFDINGVYYFYSEKEDTKCKIIPLADFFESDMGELDFSEPYLSKPQTSEERDQLVKELQAMTFEPTLDEAVKVLEDNHFMEWEVSQAVDVVVKHLKNVKKG